MKKSCNLTRHTGHLPAAKDNLSIYWRLARPELLRKWKAHGKDPVSSDVFATFAGGGGCTLRASDATRHDQNATQMTKFMLKTCVPAAAEALDRSDVEPVSVILHREGVNVRHLDKLLATIKGEYRLKTTAARMRVAGEMLERTIKNLLRRAMRDVIMKGGNISQLLELAALTFNCVTGAETDAGVVEAYWHEVREGARERFGGTNLDKFLGLEAESSTTEGKDESMESKTDTAARTNEQVCRASPGMAVLRVADDVGIELTSTCAHDLQSSHGRQFMFNSADIAGLKPRVKQLDILAKAEGMVLASQLAQLRERSSEGDEGDERKGCDDDAPRDKATNNTDTATRLRLLNQAAAKLRIAACGVFPDQEVASELAQIRLEQVKLETDSNALALVADMAFEELRAFPHDESSIFSGCSLLHDHCFGNVKIYVPILVMKLAKALLENANLKPEDGVNILFNGLVKERVGSAPAVKDMDKGVRTELGDRIVQWGIAHAEWGKDEEERGANKEFGAFLNGPLAALIGGEGGVVCGAVGAANLVLAKEFAARGAVITTLQEFAVCVGLEGGGEGEIREGVTFEEGQITEIIWKKMNLNGNLNRLDGLLLRMPRLQVLDLHKNGALKGMWCVDCFLRARAPVA